MQTNWNDALEWLFAQVPNYQIDGKKAYKPGLDNISALCDFFGNPQNGLKFVHIAGTNGKGSTSNMLASVLKEAGYRTGLYTSPHLVEFTERIRVDGKQIEKDFVLNFIEKLKKLPSDIRPSFFEFTSVMAFTWFKEQQVDIAVIETGLGGRLDSTNIIEPLICAITNVALDHQDILGEDLAQITREKAGIIKQNIPIVSGDENNDTQEIIKEKAKEKQAYFVDATLYSTEAYPSSLQGKYQVKNIRVVLALRDILNEKGFDISEDALKKGLLNVEKNMEFIGRWTIFNQNPLIILDTAHNQAGWQEAFSQLNALESKKHILLGFVQGKNLNGILSLLPKDAKYYLVRPNIERGRCPKEYIHLWHNAGLEALIYPNVQSGYEAAMQAIEPNQSLFIGGSNFVVGEFLEKNHKSFGSV